MRGIMMAFLLGWALNGLYGQVAYSTKSAKAIKFYKKGEVFLRTRQFTEAINEFNKSIQKDSDFIEAHLRLAFCFDLLQNKGKQQYHLEEVVRIAPDKPQYKNVYFSLAKLYFAQGRHELAAVQIERLSLMSIENKRLAYEVGKLSLSIDFAIENINYPIDIRPSPMPKVLNAFELQYFPVLTADEKTIIYTRRQGRTFADDEDIVTSSKNEDGEWTVPVSISPNVNSQFNEGTCTISADGRTLIFTNCEGRKRIGGCDLYVSYKVGDEWSVPENLGNAVNSRSWDSQPALSADGRKLYFVSDRAGGKGKRDIWMAERDVSGVWKNAINLGSPVNTAEEEVSPFIHVNGSSLFFSSTGFPGFGGYDLYVSELEDSLWSEPKNLGYPLNTHEDQVSLFVSTDGQTGYYSFERINELEEKESLLYSFRFPKGSIIKNRSTYLTGHVYDVETREPLGSELKLYLLGDEQPYAIFTSDPVTGRYFTVINEHSEAVLYAERQGYLFEGINLDIFSKDGKELQKDIFLRPVQAGASVRLNYIFFEFDSFELSPESITEILKIEQFLRQNPNRKILIEGHTDDRGSEAYNQLLSERRAEAVFSFLINRGVSTDLLSYQGFGERRPLAGGTDEDSQRMNRRIEFTVLE
jgi:OOP family OmpA-OmpF porin